MSNFPALPDQAPNYAALLSQCPELALINQEAAAGISSGMPPSIVAAKGRFTIKEGGVDTQCVFPAVTPQGEPHPAAGQPISVLSTVILRGKPAIEKVWYATKFTPGQEPQSPDCFSLDGVKPDSAAKIKQCEACAGCAQNVFGSGANQDGTPSKGKACTDRKIIAIYAQNSVYRFAIPPASLGNFVSYTKQLDARGIHLPTVITAIGFDAVDDYKLTFNFGGMLAEAAVTGKILPMLTSPEVMEIVGAKPSATQIAHTPVNQVADLDAARQKKEQEDAAEKKEKADKAAAAKKAKDDAAKAKAATTAQGDGLGLDMGAADPVKQEAGATSGPSDDEIANLLGL